MSNSPQISTIGVIVGRDIIGDALMKLPFLRALRNAFPRAEISWITSQGITVYAGILRESTKSFIDKIYECPPWLETHGTPDAVLKKPAVGHDNSAVPSFDLLIDTRNRWREALLARKLPHKIFIAPAARFLLSDRRPSFFRPKLPHLIDQLLEITELASGSRPRATGALPVPEQEMKEARQILREGPVYVGLAPGSGIRLKAWPRYKFEKVAISQAQKGRVPVFILGPQELAWYDELQSSVPGAQFPLQNQTIWDPTALTINHTLAIGRLLNVAVANDSGVGHMLAAADCPLISLFGPTDPLKLAPRVTRGMVIRAQDFGSSEMRAIQWEAVDAAIDRMLA